MSDELGKRHNVLWEAYVPNKGTVLAVCLLFLGLNGMFGQMPSWAKSMYEKDAKVADVSKAYEKFYEQNNFIKNRYTQDYKRFLRNKGREAFDVSNLHILRSKQLDYAARSGSYRNDNADWRAIGPFDVDLNSASVGSTPGLAHVYTVEKDGFLVAGTATAGVWKSTNNGNSWTSISKDLMVTEVKAVEVQSNTIFFGGNGSVYRSLDAGNSWQLTGKSSFKSKYHQSSDIISNGLDYYLASNHGLYKTSDNGTSWDLKVSGNFLELEFHPSNTDIIYAVAREGLGTAFYRSENGGESFTKQAGGYPTVASGHEQLRTEIAVTAAMPDRVVALATGEANGGSGLYGVYISDDTGLTWEFKCCGTGPAGPATSSNKNIMAWQTNGEVNGGQYYYDLALAVSQTNGNHIYAGGINIWKSLDGGASFINNADYIFKKAGEKYVHADIQDIRIYGNEIWVASDGGIFMSNDEGETFEKRMYGIVATDFRGFGAGAKDGEVLIGGTFHNGTLLKQDKTYDGGFVSTYSGDNTHGHVNPQNNMITYSDVGMMTLSGNANTLPTVKSLTIKPNKSYKAGESSEYAFHPTSGNTYFIGSGGSLYRTTDNGTNFTNIHNFGPGKVTKIEIAPSDPNFIYVVYLPSYNAHKKLYKTEDGGNSWQDISPDASLFQNAKLWMAWDIAVSANDKNELWLARVPQTSSNGLADGRQVFKTSNGGGSWQNLSSASINGEMITNIVHQHGTNGGVYIGTRRAVYYRNNTMAQWELFQSGLPALTYSTQLVILYSQGKIVNATQRGIYATDLFETVDKNIVVQVDKTEAICENDVFKFSNNSTGFSGNISVKWTFENGSPSVSYEKNPIVSFNGLGSHNVTLEVTENGAKYVQSQANFVTVLDKCEPESIAGSGIRTYNGSFLIIPALEKVTNEITFSTWVKRTGNTKDNAGLITMRRSGKNTGLSISSSGQVKYMWDKTGRGSTTGLTIPKDKWTHVAMTVSPTNISVYVDGIERVFEGSYAAVNFDEEILVGKDANSISYYFSGAFDETSIYDRPLSTAEVRAEMNLVKDKNLASLIHYFQYNDQGELAKDIVGSKHASFFSSPDYLESMAPVGKGVSQVKKIESFGMHYFDQLDVDLNIESGISCNSDLGVYKIERNVNGSSDSHSSDYLYIVNHFSEDGFAINGELTIGSAFQSLESAGINKDSFKLYQLDFDEAASWDENKRATSMDFIPDNQERIVFEVDEVKDMEGKFLVSYNQSNAVLAVSDIYFELSVVNSDQIEVKWFLHPEDHFIRTELQRSGDGRQFETIETIDNERGQLEFRYLDSKPLRGRNYYRVKMTYSNGDQDYSKVDHILLKSGAAQEFLYPNPVSSDEVYLKGLRLEGAEVSVFDMSGRRLIYSRGEESQRLDISQLSSGIYMVVVEERTARKQQLLVRK